MKTDEERNPFDRSREKSASSTIRDRDLRELAQDTADEARMPLPSLRLRRVAESPRNAGRRR